MALPITRRSLELTNAPSLQINQASTIISTNKPLILVQMATGGEDRLTDEHIARLAASIATRDLESVAIRYLGISVEAIKSLRDQHRDNLEALNREILQKWAYKNPGYDQVKTLAEILYRAASDQGYVNPGKVEEILGVSKSVKDSGTNQHDTLLLEADLTNLAEELRPVTEDLMKIEMAPWIKGYVSDMKELYTELEIDRIEHTAKTPEKTTPLKDYKELFQGCTANTGQVRRGKGKRVLVKADPGNGKTTFVRKVAWDWAKGFFATFTIVFLVSMKLIKLGDVLENIIIQQNPVLEGMGMTEERLKKLLEAFGDRCLIILDGFDEYTDVSGNKEHEDTIKVLRGQKLLRCSILLTSRPHCISNVEQLFHTVVRINGFSQEHAEEFAGKILKDDRNVQPVLKFECFISNRYSFENQHKCPILLLFICFLVNEDQIDIKRKDTTLGDIYMRLVRCLYRKFTVRKELAFETDSFLEVLSKLGRMAWETLISGRYSMQKGELTAQIDEYVFDYGLIIGYEDYRLLGSETADIFVTFAHRTIQEFLGSFHFMQMLSKGQKIDSLFPPSVETPILLSNRMVFEFCVWFTNCADLLPTAKSSKAGKVLKAFVLQYIDFSQMDLHDISRLYPALKMPIYNYPSTLSKSGFCLELLQKCKKVKELHLGANCWLLKEMKNSVENLASIVMIEEKEFSPSFEESPDDLQIVIRDNGFEVETIDKVLEDSKLSGKHPSLYSIITGSGWGDSFPVELSTFMYDNLQRLFLVSESGGYNIVSTQSLRAMPHLTHMNLINVILEDGSVMRYLSEAVALGNFPHLKHISFAGCEINGKLPLLFANKWSKLQHLDLHKCHLKMIDIESLGAATDKENSECVLPNLASLVVSTLWIENERNLIRNLFFNHSWKHLTELLVWFLRKEHYEHLKEVVKCSKFPSLLQLSLSMWYQDQNQSLRGFSSKSIPLLKEIKLRRFSVGKSDSETWYDHVLIQNLCRIHICECEGVNKMLSDILRYSLLHLNTLILKNCGLNRLNLVYLATANVEGRLPELEHLDISDNKELHGQLNQLLNCGWSSLLSLNVEQVILKDSEIKDLIDVRTLLSKLESGTLKSLREVRFTTGTEDPFPVNSKTPLTDLTKITAVTTARRVLDVVKTMANLVDDGMFPSLQILRVVSGSDSWYHCRRDRHRLRVAGVRVYVCRLYSESLEQYWDCLE